MSIRFILPIETFVHIYQAAMIDKLRIEEQIELTGGRGVESNSLFSFLRFILGPGLIRPLFPSEYFLTYTTMFAVFNWWGALYWYLNLLTTVPKLIRRPLFFLRAPVMLFLLLFIFEYGLAYGLTSGGPGGLRKRAFIYFFYTIFIAITFYTPYISEKVKNLRVIHWGIRLPYLILASMILIVLIFVHLRGL